MHGINAAQHRLRPRLGTLDARIHQRTDLEVRPIPPRRTFKRQHRQRRVVRGKQRHRKRLSAAIRDLPNYPITLARHVPPARRLDVPAMHRDGSLRRALLRANVAQRARVYGRQCSRCFRGMRRRQHARPQLGLLQGRRRLVDHIARQHDDHGSDSGRKSAAFRAWRKGLEEKTAAAFFFLPPPPSCTYRPKARRGWFLSYPHYPSLAWTTKCCVLSDASLPKNRLTSSQLTPSQDTPS